MDLDLGGELDRIEAEVAQLTPEAFVAASSFYAEWAPVMASALDRVPPSRILALNALTPRIRAAVDARAVGSVGAVARERVAMSAWLLLVAVASDEGVHGITAILREPWEELRRRLAAATPDAPTSPTG